MDSFTTLSAAGSLHLSSHPAMLGYYSRAHHGSALWPDHRIWSGSGVMRTEPLVQTRQGWACGGSPATNLSWENKYVTQETRDWTWLFSGGGATIKTDIHVCAYCLITRALNTKKRQEYTTNLRVKNSQVAPAYKMLGCSKKNTQTEAKQYFHINN